MRIRLIVLLSVLGIFALTVSQAAAVEAKDYFKDKTVTLIVNSKPGGGTDYGARLLASYWHDFTGGTMVVKNDPGGGGLVALNKVYKAEPDGLTLGTAVLGAHVVTFPLFERPGVAFDPVKFNYIGHFAPDPYSFSVGKDYPYESIDDLKKEKKLVFGAPDPVSTPAAGSAILIDFLGLDGHTVPGFRGGELGLAAAKKEIIGFSLHGAGLTSALDKGFIKKPFITIGMERSSWFPDAPAIAELIEPTDEQKVLLTIFNAMTTGKVFFAPPGLPEDRINFLQTTFEKIATSKAFVKQAKLRWKMWTPATPGPKVTDMIKEVMGLPKEDIAKFRALTKKYTK